MQGIEFVAWWGAVIATLVLIWDVAKWFKSGPKIREWVQLDTWYANGKVLSTEKTENGKSSELARYCHIELVNTGTLPTTIMGISASHEKSKNGLSFSISNQSFIPHYEKTLPHVLPAGEVWSCRLEMSDLAKLAEHGKPFIEVHVSHKKKPLKIWPKVSANKTAQPTTKNHC